MSKKNNKFQYPHPLIKNLTSVKHFTEQNIKQLLKQKPTFYESNYTFSTSIKNYISPKLLRVSNSKIVPEEKFGMLMQPFNAKQEVEYISRLSTEQQSWKCQHCKAYLNNQCESISLYDIKCKVCEKAQSVSLQVKNALQNIPLCYDVCYEDMSSGYNKREKNICFIVEASQFNHNYRVHEAIEACLKSLESTLEPQGICRKESEVQTEDEETSVKSCYEIQFPSSDHVQYNISFVLFNDKNIFLINQSTNDVQVFNHSFIYNRCEQEEVNNQSIIGFNDFFRPISEISQQTFELIQDIMYDSYLKGSSCLDVVTEFVYGWVDQYFVKGNDLNQNCQRQTSQKRLVEYKFFVNSLKFTKRNQTQSEVLENNKSNTKGLLSNVSNTISASLPFSKPRQTKTHESLQESQQPSPQLTLSSNFEFFYLPQSNSSNPSVSQKDVINKLNNNLYKMYPRLDQYQSKDSNEFFNQLYYDLFENLTAQKYFNVHVNIIASEKVEVIAVGNQMLGYNDCTQQFKKTHSSSQTGQKFNSYSITLNSLEQANTLPIDLKINPTSSLKSKKQNSETKHFIQITLSYTKPLINSFNQPLVHSFQRVFHVEVASLDRAINYRQHIYASLSTYVDDEVLFYFHLRWILMQCHRTKTNHTIQKRLYEQMDKIADQFKDSYGQIDFHKEYIRIFLYAFMITNKPIINSINQNFYYERHQWLKGSMECLAKSLYPRTYQITNNKEKAHANLKNVKSSPKNFRSDSLLLLDNGKDLHMIIGEDNSVQDLKQIFGTCFIHEIKEMTELPELETNQRYRELIELARSQHESNFLPLKVMELFSSQFDRDISNSLYVKDNHYKFMRQLWDMEPAKKRIRS